MRIITLSLLCAMVLFRSDFATASNLHIYVSLNWPHKVRELLENSREGINQMRFTTINDRHENGATALWSAAAKGRIDIVRLLIESSADVNLASDTYRSTPLIVACEQGHEIIATLLIEQGADVNVNSREGTALMRAADLGLIEVVRILLSRGADANLRDEFYRDALMYAARSKHKEIFELLLPITKSVLVQDFTGRTVRDHAKGNEAFLALIGEREKKEKAMVELEELKRYLLPKELLALLTSVHEKHVISKSLLLPSESNDKNELTP